MINPEQIISIIGIARSADELEITSVMRVEAFTHVPNAKASEFVAELRGAEGNVIAYASVHSLPGQAHGGCGCGGSGTAAPQYPFVFQAFVPDIAGGSSLVIRRGRTEVWTRHASETAPRLKEFRAEIEGDRLALIWEGTATPKHETEASVQYSNDEGKHWHGLTTGLRGNRATVDLAGLPGGPIELRLLLSEGFYTASSEKVRIHVPHRPPHVSVLMPRNGQTVVEPGTMRLWGVETTGAGERVPDESAVWFLDGKELARGFDHFIETPTAGEHRLLLVVQAEGAPAAEVEVTFKTVAIEAGKRHSDVDDRK